MTLKHNSNLAISNWVKNALKDVPDPVKDRMFHEAHRLLGKGYLRGDISEYWVNNYPHIKDYLNDLYL